jgi:hypothetical protein
VDVTTREAARASDTLLRRDRLFGVGEGDTENDRSYRLPCLERTNGSSSSPKFDPISECSVGRPPKIGDMLYGVWDCERSYLSGDNSEAEDKVP